MTGMTQEPDARILRGDIIRACREQADTLREYSDDAIAGLLAEALTQVANALDGNGPGGEPVLGHRSIQLEERQLIRPDATVLMKVVIPANVRWMPEIGPEDRIEGPCLVRIRALPDGPWEVIAQFPDGYPPPLLTT